MNEQRGFFGSVITAMVTPFDSKSFEVDYGEAQKLAVYLVENGSDALVLSGTTGEAPATHVEEKAQLIKAVRSVLIEKFPQKHIPIIAGTGSNDTAHAIRNGEIALESGADAQLVVTPYYSRPTQQGLLKHFEMIIKNVDLPIILYDVPSRSGVKIAYETYQELAKYEQIVAVKDATAQVYQALKNLRAMNELRSSEHRITLYSGDDSLLLPFLSVGADGIISVASHLVGKEFSEAIKLFKAAQFDEALAVFEKTISAIEALNGRGAQAVDTKAALQMLGVIKSRQTRLPNVEASDHEAKAVLDCINKAHF
jgi:4-hydroxy-tetrahydrodipicolinate synthase